MAETSSLLTSKYMEIPVDLIVIPRSFSSSLVSVKRMSPAFAEAMIPAFETRESVRVDFPWSTTRGLQILIFLLEKRFAHHER